MRRNLLLLFAIAAACTPLANAANVIVNGDFETGPIESIGTVTGWTVTGAVADVGDNYMPGFSSPTHSAAFSAGGSSEGNVLSQSFTTIIGQVYTLSFDAGATGVLDEGADAPLQLQIQVLGAGNGILRDETITPFANNAFGPVTLQPHVYNFTADSTSTTLQFTDIGGFNTNSDVILDTVVVDVAAVPEPGTCALVFIGAGAVACGLRRRQARGLTDLD